tara:strand:- start:162 stop:1226 length:1065 start_codon:yes stop_codon:yes gene_type:complete
MSKGGTTSGSTEIPAWLENAAIENINKARDVSQIGYVPYYGPDVAAFSPMQQQSMQSTGNAASAFGLAPQGFNAMAGMPQAETFAGGLQGYSSAPLYEQSLDNLFANAPAQYRAMSDMFIDPFTGAAPRSGYGATPIQTGQMISGGGGGGGGGETPFQFPQDQTSDAEIFGVNRAYNPYKYSMPTEDISGDGVVDYRDMSFGEGGRRDVPMGERIVNGLLGGPLRAVDFVQGSLFDMSGAGDPSMSQAESVSQMNEANARYAARLQADRQRALDVSLAQQAQEDLIAAGLIENPISNAVTTPYRAPVITQSTVNRGGGGNPNKGNNAAGGTGGNVRSSSGVGGYQGMSTGEAGR